MMGDQRVSPLRSSLDCDLRPKMCQMADQYREMLVNIGEDPSRPGLLDTPNRAAKAMMFFTKGYSQTLSQFFTYLLQKKT